MISQTFNFYKTMITKEFDIEEAKAITAGETDGRLVSRDGFPARIIFWEAKGNFPIIALIDDGSDEHPYCYTMNGRSDTRDFVRTSHDLMIEYGDNGIINTRDEAIEALMKDYDEGANIRDVIETAMVFADTHPKGGEQ